MRMQAVDVGGTLHSAAGLRFGGFRTDQFLAATSELEKYHPGVREEIVAEAHQTCVWLHRFPELAFLVPVLVTHSILIGLLCFVTAYLLEIVRFYTLGTSIIIAQLSRLWSWLKAPGFIGASISLFPDHRVTSIVLLVFLLVQGYFTILSTVAMLPLRLPLSTWMLQRFGMKNTQIHNMEGMALTWSINKRGRTSTVAR